MKKFFEKHSLGKTLGILFLISLILTWIIPAGSFNGSEYVESQLVRIGLSDVGNLFYYMVAMSIDKVLFLLILGAFYGVLSKIPAYQKLVNKIAKSLKGKEILFVVLTSIFVAVLTSFSVNTFAVLIFVPFLINIILKMKLDRMTAFVATFGSMLIGVIGATFGSDGFTWLNYYFTQQGSIDFLTTGMLYRVLVLVVGLLLFNFFTIVHIKSTDKKKTDESKDDLFVIEDVKEKTKVLPVIIILSILGIVIILGSINWSGYFGIETFNNFHTWLKELTVGKDFTLISYILGSSAAALGDQVSSTPWNIYILMSVLILTIILLVIVYRFSFEKAISSILDGMKKFGKLALALVCAYSVYIIFYFSPMMVNITNKLMPVEGTPDINIDYKGSGVAYFNLDTDNDLKADKNLINQDTNKDGKCDLNCDSNGDGYPDKYLDFDASKEIDDKDAKIEKTFSGTSTLNYDSDADKIPNVNVDTDYNIGSNILTAFITSVFHIDLNYTGYLISGHLISGFGIYLEIVFFIYLTMFGFVSIIAPTSALLVLGLVYTKIEYKDWLKYIWKFAVGMLLCLVMIYLLMFYL